MAGLASPEVIGRYAIYGRLASGGMATIHFGRLLGGAGFSRTVAIKRLHPHLAEDPDFLSTMIDEARLAARIHHPNVVPTLDVVTADGELLLVMEYVRGESLARLLRAEQAQGKRVELPVASAVIVGTLHGLHAAHEATSDHGEALGIVHRDVSPQNILVGVDGAARVIDFGVAKAANRLSTTREGIIKGKMAYMAPEQLTGGQVTRQADVYAMGVVLWEMLANKRLFQADNDPLLMRAVLAGAEGPPSRHAPGLPPGLDEVVMTALALDPARRFPTAMDMAEALMQVVPPAFSTVVGRWCGEAAKASLDKRGQLLADIESTSGVAPVPAPPSVAPVSQSGVRSSGRLPPARSIPGAMTTIPDDPPAMGSQASSLALETPRSSAIAGPSTRRLAQGAIVTGLVVGGLVPMIFAAVILARRASPDAPPAPAAAPPPAAGAPAPTPSPSVAPQPPLAPEPAAAAPPPQAAPAPQPAAEPAPPPAPAPELTPTAAVQPAALSPSPTQPPASHPVAQPAAPKPTGCNPPYEFDSDGHKKWKRQCL